MRRCTNDLKALLKEDDNQVKIHWLWNRVIAMLLAAFVISSVLMAEPFMDTPLVLGLREIFFRYPWDRSDDVVNRGSDPRLIDNGKSMAGACNQLYQFLLVTSLFVACLLTLGNEVKRVLVGPKFQIYPNNCLKLPTQFWTTRPTCSASWCTNVLKLAFCGIMDYALMCGVILAIWMALAVWASGGLTLSDRVTAYQMNSESQA